MKKSLLAFLILCVSVLTGTTHAQVNGVLFGKIVDKRTSEALIGANILIVGTVIGGSTDIDGNYRLVNIPIGKVDIRVSYISYQTKVLTGIEIKPGQPIRVDVALDTDDISIDEVVVEAEAVKNTEGLLLLDRKKSSNIVDAISAEQIKRSTDNNAGDAMKRVTGVTVVGGKYVYVRGLGERYSNTTLNGASIPSPEPERKVIPFDIFPSNLIQSMTTSKSFSPDQPGDFAGGSVQIQTVEFPDKETFSFGIGTGFNSVVHSGEIVGHVGGKYDFIGFDDGNRAIPNVTTNQLQTYEGQLLFMENASKTHQLQNSLATPNQSYSISYGNQFALGEYPVGVLGAFSYNNKFSYKEETLFLPSAQVEDPVYDLNTKNSANEILWGAIVNISSKISSTDKITLKSLYNTSAERETRYSTGLVSRSGKSEIQSRRARFITRGLGSTQLAGEHFLHSLFQTKANWKLTLSRATRYEPDNQEYIYGYNDNEQKYAFLNNFGRANGRFYSDLADNDLSVNLDFTTPFTQWDGFQSNVKFGGVARSKSREFSSHRFQFALNNTSSNAQFLLPHELITYENVANGTLNISDATTDNDGYKANEYTISGYGMVDMPVYPGLRVITGVRYEYNLLDLGSFDPRTGASPFSNVADISRSTSNLLFALNTVYSVTDNQNIRFGFSNTIARPEFRELAPFRFLDYTTNIVGNPYLEEVSIQNVDLRWEYFSRPGEIFAISTFYKSFQNPIEVFLSEEGSTYITFPVNADKAHNFGVELEGRIGLDLIAKELENYTLISNVTFVKSETSFDQNKKFPVFLGNTKTEWTTANITNLKRPLQGQSPYVLNLTLIYQNPEWNNEFSILYNTFGKRISEVGTVVGTYKYDDTYEQSRQQLDMTYNQRFLDGYSLKIGVSNLLNSEHIYKIGDDVTRSYKSGIAVSAGLSYSF